MKTSSKIAIAVAAVGARLARDWREIGARLARDWREIGARVAKTVLLCSGDVRDANEMRMTMV